MKLCMAAIGAPADVAAEISGFTVYNGTGGFLLYIGYVMSGRTERVIGVVPYLLDFIITDGNHLRSYRMD